MSQQKFRQQLAQSLARKELPYQCFVCEENLDNIFDWEVSHVKPKTKDGELNLANLRICCLQCNRDMGSCHLYAYIMVFFPNHSQYYVLQKEIQTLTGPEQKMIEKDILKLSKRQKTKRLQKRLWCKQVGEKKATGSCPCCHQTLQNPDVENLYICPFDKEDISSQVLVCSQKCLSMAEPWKIFFRRYLFKISKMKRCVEFYCSSKRQKNE